MQTSLRGIARKAKQDRKYRFGNLYGMLNKQALYLAWHEINKNAVAGVDRETTEGFKKNLEGNLDTLVEELKTKRYKARLVKRVNIPKGNGKTRPLGVTALRDKIVQRAVANILEAIYEQDFLKSSHGYRRGSGARQTACELARDLMGRCNYVVEADIRSYFDNIDHDWLMRMLELRVKDTTLLRLIRKWLRAGVLDTDGKVISPETGCPQGSVISPILANIYLHYALDLWFEKVVKLYSKGEAFICRFADDFICAFKYKDDATRFHRTLEKRMAKFKLVLAEEKTKVIKLSRFDMEGSKSFDFLGFEYRWTLSHNGKPWLQKRTSRSKLRKSIEAIKQWCKANRNKKIKCIIEDLNAKLRGYFNYYGVIGNSDGISRFYSEVLQILYKWLNRRSQRRSFNWGEFFAMIKRYGLIKPRITEKPENQIRFEECFV